jgi:hypothetical protein
MNSLEREFLNVMDHSLFVTAEAFLRTYRQVCRFVRVLFCRALRFGRKLLAQLPADWFCLVQPVSSRSVCSCATPRCIQSAAVPAVRMSCTIRRCKTP